MILPVSSHICTGSVHRRCATSDGVDKLEVLQKCEGLNDFLPRAIAFLTANQNENQGHAEQVAHYLMGKVDYLPVGLAAPSSVISLEAKAALSDLLRTHNSGIGGKAEVPEKTIAKLQTLHYNIQLAAWQCAAPEDERQARLAAVNAIQQLLQTGGRSLSLSGLGLTTIPPLPAYLEALDLRANRITSLGDRLTQMNALVELDLAYNQISSLNGSNSSVNTVWTK